MRGNTFRRKAPPNTVRIVKSVENSDQDYFLNYEEANKLITRGLLRAIDLPGYPHSFKESNHAGRDRRTAEHPQQSAT